MPTCLLIVVSTTKWSYLQSVHYANRCTLVLFIGTPIYGSLFFGWKPMNYHQHQAIALKRCLFLRFNLLFASHLLVLPLRALTFPSWNWCRGLFSPMSATSLVWRYWTAAQSTFPIPFLRHSPLNPLEFLRGFKRHLVEGNLHLSHRSMNVLHYFC